MLVDARILLLVQQDFRMFPKKFREDYALYVLSEMLSLQIGNQAYFQL